MVDSDLAESDQPSVLVDPAISLAKLTREVEQWRKHEDLHRRRGLLLARHDGFRVDLLIVARAVPVPVVVGSVRLEFDNYDVWPPSLVFTDPLTGDALAPGVMPPAQAFDFRETPPRPLIPGAHPRFLRPFLCVPGIREYHEHDEHSGDHWLRHRGTGRGTLEGIATTLQRSIGASIRGLGMQTTTTVLPNGVQFGGQVVLAQGPPPMAAAPTPLDPAEDGVVANGVPPE